MVKNHCFVLLASLVFLAACGENSGGKGGNSNPLGAKPGWNQNLIDTLIACQPNPGKVCDCVIPKVTAKYTPDQVREKSPYVASDMLAIKSECDSSSGTSTKPLDPVEQHGYSSISGENCQTGDHDFPTFQSMCEGLKSESLNHACASEVREQFFHKMKCPGQFGKLP